MLQMEMIQFFQQSLQPVVDAVVQITQQNPVRQVVPVAVQQITDQPVQAHQIKVMVAEFKAAHIRQRVVVLVAVQVRPVELVQARMAVMVELASP